MASGSLIAIAFFIIWKAEKPSPLPIVVAEPYHGIRLQQNEVSNKINRAQSGSLQDALELANHYYFVSRDTTNAIVFLEMAAKLGSSDAALNLGQLYASDERVTGVKEARRWFEVAQTLGDSKTAQKLRDLTNHSNAL